MDPAQEIELEALRHQEAMNKVIDRRDSPVQRYYEDATVFVTGGSGFIGKQLIEKLFRSCSIKKLYLLTRFKKGRTISERLQHMLKDPLYDTLRKKQPNFADLIVPVEGDVAEIKLGLNDKNWKDLSAEVNIIFHVAATVRFDEPLRFATLTNVRGTREALALAKDCINFKKFVHVSTAFTHATKSRASTDVAETFYPSPVPPEALIQLAENVDEKRLDDITPNLINDWPNTYTFTKALAEEYIRTNAGDVPVCIVRPSIVVPAYYEPGPGWLDINTIAGPSGILMGSGLGVLKVVNSDADSMAPMAPVDYVNNAIIAAAWDSEHNRDKEEISIYTVRKLLRLGNVRVTLEKEMPKLITTRAVYKAGLLYIKNSYLYFVLALLLHYIPAFILDFVSMITGRKPNKITSFVDVFKKIDKLWSVYQYFVTYKWNFKDDNLQDMVKRMNDADKAIFNCDMSTIDYHEFVMVWAVGIRKYILKDGLKNTHKGLKKQQIFTIVNYFVVTLYAFTLWYIFSVAFQLVKNIIGLIFY